MKILIVGGTRFLGKNIVRILARHQHDVTSINIDKDAASHLPAGVESLFVNRKDHDQVRSVLSGRKFDAVLDIVSAPTVPEDVEVIVEAVGGPLKHYVFCSSSSVYRKTGIYPITEDTAIKRGPEDGAIPYTQDKIACEQYLMKRFTEDGLPVTIIRPKHIYGPENYSYREGFHFDRLTRGRPMLIPGDGSLLTQFGYVEDIADAFRLAIEQEASIGQAYTITGAEMMTLDAYVDLLGSVTGVSPEKVYFSPRLLARFDRPGMYFGESESIHEGHACFSIEKARAQLGYAPQYSLEAGMKASFSWYQETGGNTYRMRVLDFSFEDQLIELAQSHEAYEMAKGRR